MITSSPACEQTCFTAHHSPASLCLCVPQGAGAVTCAWLCSRIKPPYTSRTKTPLQSDIISPAPSAKGSPPPPMETSDLLSVWSCRLRPDVADSHRTSALTYLNIYSDTGGGGGWGVQLSTTNLPAKSLWLAIQHTHTYWSYLQCRHTLSPGLSDFGLYGSSWEQND